MSINKPNIRREMLNNALGTLVKRTKIKISCWEVMKNAEFNFLKVEKFSSALKNCSKSTGYHNPIFKKRIIIWR